MPTRTDSIRTVYMEPKSFLIRERTTGAGAFLYITFEAECLQCEYTADADTYARTLESILDHIEEHAT